MGNLIFHFNLAFRMSKAVVDFYYDVVSPWSYIGFEVLLRYQSSWNIDINLRPVFLGGVMQGSGNQPPATLPAKATYGMIDLNRSARYYGLEISMPSVFPTNTITCQRFLIAMQQGLYNIVIQMKNIKSLYFICFS